MVNVKKSNTNHIFIVTNENKMSSEAISALLGTKEYIGLPPNDLYKFNSCTNVSISEIIELIKVIRATPDKQLDILVQLLSRPSTLPAPAPETTNLNCCRHVCCKCRC